MDSIRAQIRAIPYVSKALCQACEPCQARAVCRSKALLILDRGEPPFVDASRCHGCNACLPACPFGALHLQER